MDLANSIIGCRKENTSIRVTLRCRRPTNNPTPASSRQGANILSERTYLIPCPPYQAPAMSTKTLTGNRKTRRLQARRSMRAISKRRWFQRRTIHQKSPRSCQLHRKMVDMIPWRYKIVFSLMMERCATITKGSLGLLDLMVYYG